MMERIAKPQVLALACVLVLGLALRIWDFPSRYQLRDADELGYTYGGPLLWEGITPGFKQAPAGIQAWIGWIYCACGSLSNLMEQKGGEHRPLLLRPFYAVEETLFNTYRDLSTLRQVIVALILITSLAGICAAFQSGFRRAGVSGGLLAGGLMALLPIFVRASGMAKPYMPAWSCAVIAHYFASTRTQRMRWAGSAIFMGLSISSRIEMLLFFPVILWELWNEKEKEGFGRTAVRMTTLMIIVALLISPWLMTNLLGNIRAIVTIRFSGPPILSSLGPLFRDFAWLQGLGPVAVVVAAGLVAGSADKRRTRWLLLLILVALFLTMLKSSPYGLRHHGATVVAVIAIAPLALARISRLHPKAALLLAAALLILPAVNAVSAIRADQQSYVSDQATEWVEQHVAPGTRVYLSQTLHDPLPTQQSADSLWAAVTDTQAWRTKFQQGLNRFDLPVDQIPRALSEENLIQERGNRRRWFILGGNQGIKAPRFDIKIISGGSPFDMAPGEAVAEFKRTGGVLIWRQSRHPEFQLPKDELGIPAVSWTDQRGEATSVHYEPVEAKPGQERAR
jgi:hypothetical protein